MLELVEYITPRGRDLGVLATNAVGCAHLALIVTDIEHRYERMRALGVAFRNPPVAISAGANAGGFACYFQSSATASTLELLQPSPARIQGMGLA